jgi:hypothetical protein
MAMHGPKRVRDVRAAAAAKSTALDISTVLLQVMRCPGF